MLRSIVPKMGLVWMGRIMSKKAIETAIRQLPELTDFGVGTYNEKRLAPEVRKQNFEKDRAALLESLEGFEKACHWLSRQKKIKSINTKHSSYGLKHIAEKEVGYITNGVFIAAAIHCGFTVKTYPGDPNVSINISEKSLKVK